ncbi:Uncharacterised protein [Vibrio vulnificus]|nr:Uncharacterised protein [Vibrio vulnificus]
MFTAFVFLLIGRLDEKVVSGFSLFISFRYSS